MCSKRRQVRLGKGNCNKESMPERQDVQFPLYLADSSNVWLHPCYYVLQYFPGPCAAPATAQHHDLVTFCRWPQARVLESSHRMVKAEAYHIVYLILSQDMAMEMQPSSSLLTFKKQTNKFLDFLFELKPPTFHKALHLLLSSGSFLPCISSSQYNVFSLVFHTCQHEPTLWLGELISA